MADPISNKGRYVSGLFIPHGEYRVEVQNNILLIEARGPFNKEVVTAYTADVLQALEQMEPPWGQVIVLHQDSVFTPEAESQLAKKVAQSKALGLVASGVVILNTQIEFVIKQQLSQVYKQSDVLHNYFDAEDAARSWVVDELANYPQR